MACARQTRCQWEHLQGRAWLTGHSETGAPVHLTPDPSRRGREGGAPPTLGLEAPNGREFLRGLTSSPQRVGPDTARRAGRSTPTPTRRPVTHLQIVAMPPTSAPRCLLTCPQFLTLFPFGRAPPVARTLGTARRPCLPAPRPLPQPRAPCLRQAEKRWEDQGSTELRAGAASGQAPGPGRMDQGPGSPPAASLWKHRKQGAGRPAGTTV